MQPDYRHIVILVHGIRTFGSWQNRLNTLIDEHYQKSEVLIYRYGYFSLLAFLIPPLRMFAVRPFRRYLASQKDDWKNARVDIIAHSFGTHIVACALRGLKEDDRPQVNTVVLSGSVLKQLFRWETLLGSQGCVHRVVNDCGTRDIWPLVAQMFVIGMGIAGRRGFAGITGRSHGLINRYFPIGHSGFFEGDEFMKRYWLPLLTDQEVALGEETIPPAPGFTAAWEGYADPIKVGFLLLPLAIVAMYVYGRIQEEELKRQLAQDIALQLEQDLNATNRMKTAPAKSEVGSRQVLFDSAKRHGTDKIGPSPVVERLALQRLFEWAVAKDKAAQAIQTGGWSWKVDKPKLDHWDRPPAHSPDGRFSILRTGKKDQRGEAYRLDNNTLRLMPLEMERDRDGSDELQYIGFGTAGKRVILSRGWFVEIYGVDGKPLKWFPLVERTKDPITHISTFAGGSSLVIGDANGETFCVELTEDGFEWCTRGGSATSPLARTAVRANGGKEVILVHRDGVAKYWGADGQTLPIPHDAKVVNAAFAAEGPLFLTVARDGTTNVWREGAEEIRLQQEFKSDGELLYGAFSETGSKVLTVSKPMRADVWDVETGQPVWTLSNGASSDARDANDAVEAAHR